MTNIENKSREREAQELRLKVLHSILYDTICIPELATSYTKFIRNLRAEIHPVGVYEPRIVELNSKLKFKVDLGDRLGCDFYYGYYQEYFDSQLFFSLLNVGDTLIDIGANFGYYAITGANIVGNQGQVFAFEPNQEAYKLLTENVELNNFANIVNSYPVCVGEKDATTSFYISEESSFSSLAVNGRSKIREEITVPMFRLDSFLSSKNLNSVKVIKIDVEGYEYAVLQGAKETLKHSPEIIIMMEVSAKNLDSERRENLIKILTEIYELDYFGSIVDVSLERPRILSTPEEMGNLSSANVFMTRKNSAMENTLIESYQNLCLKIQDSLIPKLNLLNFPQVNEAVEENKRLQGTLLKTLSEEKPLTYNEQRLELLQAKAEIERLSLETEARLAEILLRDEKIQHLREENEFLRQENSKSILERIKSKLTGK